MNGEMKQKWLVLAASTYQITNDRSGEVTTEGMTVFYMPTDDLGPSEDLTARDRGQISKGMQPAKANMLRSLSHQIEDVPGIYEASLKMVTRQLKTMIEPVQLSFVCPVSLNIPEKADRKK